MPLENTSSTRRTRALILTFFVLSGSTGLVYEIVWMKMLTLTIGNTVFSTTTVLTAFMGGLALGSFLAGRFADRLTEPLKVYAILEGAIGVYALVLPLLIGWTEPLFRLIYQDFHTSFYAFSLLRFLVCGAILLVPTTLMGATLPVLSKYFVDRPTQLGWTIGKLYGANMFGAVMGSMAAGFVLIPAVGVARTIYIAAFLNLAIAAAVLKLGRRATQTAAEGSRARRKVETRKTAARPGEVTKSGARGVTVTVLVAIGLSGVAAMIYQIAWTRVLSLSIGSSVYAFSLIVSAFICGLSLGSLALARWIDRASNVVLALALVQAAIGVSALLTVPVLGKLPTLVTGLVLRYFDSFTHLHVAEFSVIFLLMLIPTFLMGGAFPSAVKICVRDLERVGQSVGNVYAVNTLGAIIGSFSAGFLLIPWLGTQSTIAVAVAINIIAAGIVLLRAPTLAPVKRVGLTLGVVVLPVVAWQQVPSWDPLILTSGPYLYADLYQDLATDKDIGVEAAMREGHELVFFKEGLTATVSVTKTADGDLALNINGKTDATVRGDAATQLMLGHLPLLLHEAAKDVLVIGMGSGMTLGAVQLHPVESVDIVEIEAAVIEASEHFRAFTRDPLNDPRAEVILADGRNHLAFTDEQYDVIISEPSNVWISGMGNLFTREFFDLAKRRLRRGGLMCQWVHAYAMSSDDFKTIVRTFASVFPHTMMWEADFGNDYLLIGYTDDLSIDDATLQRRLSEEWMGDDLARMNMANGSAFVGKLLAVDEALSEYTRGVPLHTDDNSLLEYSAPRALLSDRSPALVRDLYRHRSSPARVLQALGLTEDVSWLGTDPLDVFESKSELAAGYVSFLEGDRQGATQKLERARVLNPVDYDATYLLAKLYYEFGNAHESAGRVDAASDAYRRSVGVIDDLVEADQASSLPHFDLAVVYAQANLRLGVLALGANALQQAAEALQKSLAGPVRYPEAHNNLGVVREREGRYEEAREEYQRALALNPRYVPGRMNLGNVYLRDGRYAEATESYLRVLEQRPDHAVARYNLGVAYFNQSRWEEAESEWTRALELDPNFAEARRSLDVVRSETERR